MIALAAAAAIARRGSAGRALAVTRVASIVALACAAASIALLIYTGPVESPTVGLPWLGPGFLVDSLSAGVFALVAFVGFLVLEYSRNYLAGDPRQNVFLARMALTIAAATFMATAGNLVQMLVGWIGMSLSLHQLLLYYPERRRARVAARKKYLVARVGDGCLAAAFGLLAFSLGSADIVAIRESVTGGGGMPLETTGWLTGAALLIVVAAVLKSAQFPTHGWITEVMETPTPVSALLHAGIVNAGGFLILRFADVVLLAPVSMQLLLVVGGFTALYGSIVMTTQNTVKSALAYSTVAQMGFMLLQCGLGAFSSAGLHLVTHSLYKAHSFLASGTAVQQVGLLRSVANDERPGVPLLLGGFAAALAVYLGIAALFEALFDHRTTGALAVQTLGAIFIMGLFVLIARGATSRQLFLRIVPAAALAATLYFALQIAAATFIDVPPVDRTLPGAAELVLVCLVLVSFGLLTLYQALPTRSASRWHRAAFVHLKNGLYSNVVMNRLTGAAYRDYAR